MEDLRKEYASVDTVWTDVRRPRIHKIGSKVIGIGRSSSNLYHNQVGTLIRSIISEGAIHQGYYIVEYPDGATRTYMVVRQV